MGSQVVDNKRLLKLVSPKLYSYCIDCVKFRMLQIEVETGLIPRKPRDPVLIHTATGGYPLKKNA
jgi:hypothetical protein